MALPRQTPRSVIIEKFRALGWSGPSGGSDHMYMTKGKRKQKIPNPHGADIHVSLLARMLRQAEISHEDWLGAGK